MFSHAVSLHPSCGLTQKESDRNRKSVKFSNDEFLLEFETRSLATFSELRLWDTPVQTHGSIVRPSATAGQMATCFPPWPPEEQRAGVATFRAAQSFRSRGLRGRVHSKC